MVLYESRKTSILSRLKARFAIRAQAVAPNFSIPSFIYLTSDVDALLRTGKAQLANGDLTGGAGSGVSYFTVPDGKRWELLLGVIPATTGTTSIVASVAGTGYRLSLDGTTQRLQDLYRILLSERDWIGLVSTGDVGDGTRPFELQYVEEDAF